MNNLNKQLSQILQDIATIYQYEGGEDRYRAYAYQKASESIKTLPDCFLSYLQEGTLNEIPGIGEHITEDILEFAQTGSIKRYESLKKKAPLELLDLINVRGIGLKSLKTIHSKLHINTKEELINALNDGRVEKLKGFGKDKVEKILKGVQVSQTLENRMLLWDAIEQGENIKNELEKLNEVHHIELAGSIRRKNETIGDIDIIASSSKQDRDKIFDVFTLAKHAKFVLEKGKTTASIILKDTNKQVDLRIVDDEEWGSALLYFTGSKEHNIKLRTIAKEKGWKLNEYGVFSLKNSEKINSNSEKDIYKLLGFQYIPPEMREDKGELELAAHNQIPDLIKLSDIKGDLQMHSDWSDGKQNIEDLAQFVLTHFNYEYIALTDHSISERLANGMNEEDFRKQITYINKINKNLGKQFIKKGAEVDILLDGTLDLNNNLLSELDWVCASIHSGFNQDNTERLILACENPLVNCIGHPSGRLIGKRESYIVDWKRVFKVAKQTNTALEINAQPDRMDLNDELAFEARKAGVKLVISTDSHTQGNFYYIKLGVFIAQRAWCTKSDILNTNSWNEVKKFIELKRNKMGLVH